MTFDLSFPSSNPAMSRLSLKEGELLFVLGANGTGKSGLMAHFASKRLKQTRWIAALRRTWFDSDASNMTAVEKARAEESIEIEETRPSFRYRYNNSAQRLNMTIFHLIEHENRCNRSITAAARSKDLEEIEKATENNPSITAMISEILHRSNIPITIEIAENERLMASRDGSPRHSAIALSDGERNALLIAADVLTAPPGTLLLIDEPERGGACGQGSAGSLRIPLVAGVWNRGWGWIRFRTGTGEQGGRRKCVGILLGGLDLLPSGDHSTHGKWYVRKRFRRCGDSCVECGSRCGEKGRRAVDEVRCTEVGAATDTGGDSRWG